MCRQEQWLKGLYGNRLKDSLEAWAKFTCVLPCNSGLRTLENSFSLTILCYWLLSIYLMISQTVKKMERDRTSLGGGRRFQNKKIHFFSLSPQSLCQFPRTKPGSQRHSGPWVLGTDKISKRQQCLWAISWSMKPSPNSLDSERSEAASEHFVSHICFWHLCFIIFLKIIFSSWIF